MVVGGYRNTVEGMTVIDDKLLDCASTSFPPPFSPISHTRSRFFCCATTVRTVQYCNATLFTLFCSSLLWLVFENGLVQSGYIKCFQILAPVVVIEVSLVVVKLVSITQFGFGIVGRWAGGCSVPSNWSACQPLFSTVGYRGAWETWITIGSLV